MLERRLVCFLLSSVDMARTRGFTLIELVVVVAVAAVLATVTAIGLRYGTRNANLSTATYDFVVRLGGIRANAMADGKDYLLVFADAPSSDATGCAWYNDGACTRYFVLANPTAAWSLATFDPAHPANNAELVRSESFPRGVHLDLGATFTPPPPFSSIVVNDSDLRVSCGSAQTCFAIRFDRRGQVDPEFATSTTTTKAGFGFVLGTDLSGGGGHRQGLSVAFPSGIVKTVTF